MPTGEVDLVTSIELQVQGQIHLTIWDDTLEIEINDLTRTGIK